MELCLNKLPSQMLVRPLSASLTEAGGDFRGYANSLRQYKTSRVNTFALYSGDEMMYIYDRVQIPILDILAMPHCKLNANN